MNCPRLFLRREAVVPACRSTSPSPRQSCLGCVVSALCPLLLAGLLTGSAAFAADGDGSDGSGAVESAARSGDSPLDFTNDIVPILTKAGCNGGGCHGKATGRGGFKLSLFGFEPDLDFDAISRGSRGRRVFPAAPEESLLLQKAIMAVPHGGGRRFDADDPSYLLLKEWIAANMPWGADEAPRIRALEIEPAMARLAEGSRQQLTVLATYSDGSRRDVTRLTDFRSQDPSVATVDEQGLVDVQQRCGEAAIVALYQGQGAVSRIVVPAAIGDEQLEERLATLSGGNLIDRHIAEKLRRLRVPPAEISDDASFLRRATLQIAGRLPTLDESQAFVDDRSPDKRERLVDRLLASEDYADHFAQKWADLLRVKRRGQRDRLPGTIAFHRWIRDSLANNKPYDRFVREILTATGNVAVNPPAQWYAEVRYLDRYVDDTAQVFLGIRIGCARCHHHPFEKFSQEDYFGLAAFFARVDRKGGSGVAERRANETVVVKPSGEVKHPVTDEVVAPRGLDAEPVEVARYDDPRRQLADWLAAPDNPYFARAFVNRMWAHFFGRGLVSPMDDMRVTNPPTNEPLLDELAAEFVGSGFDMRELVRRICTSTTYQLSSRADALNLEETKNHAWFYPQRLKAEVLLDALDQVTEVPTSYGGLPAGTRAVELPDEDFSNEFLRLFGRPQRESACECERTAEPSLSQSLFAMNNAFVLDKVSSAKGYAGRLAEDPRDESAKVEELFRKVLIRSPSDEELRQAFDYLAEEPDRRAAYGNLLWALINTKEFLFIH